MRIVFVCVRECIKKYMYTITCTSVRMYKCICVCAVINRCKAVTLLARFHTGLLGGGKCPYFNKTV